MAATTASFWDRMAERYAKKPVGDLEAYEKKLEITRGFLTHRSNVLEFGCGTGTTALIHAPYAGTILATDVSAKMLGIAKAKAYDQGIDNVEFRQIALEDLDEPAESFDMVMAHSILHLVEDKDTAIAKSLQWLKPGGIFISSTVCLGDGWSWWKPLIAVMRLVGFAPKVECFSQDSLVAAIKAAGFIIEQDWRPKDRRTLFCVARKPDA